MSGAGSGVIIGFGFHEIVIILALICFVAAYLMSIKYLVEAAVNRGSAIGRARLWFIGLFMTPLVLGLLAIASKSDS